MKKLIPYLLFISLLTLLVGCGNDEDARDKERQQEQQQITAQQKVKFTNIGACLKQKQKEAGISEDAKPTADMFRQCISLTKK